MFENEYLLYLSNLCYIYLVHYFMEKIKLKMCALNMMKIHIHFWNENPFFFLHILCKGLTDS